MIKCPTTTLLATFAVLIAFANTSSAATLDVINHSFETSTFTAWVKGGGLTSSGSFDPTTSDGFYTGTPTGMDGTRLAYQLRGSLVPAGYFEQTLAGADGIVSNGDDPTLAANTEYTITVGIGYRNGTRADSDGPEDFAGFVIELFADTTVVGSSTRLASAGPLGNSGEITDHSFSFTTSASPTGLGDALKIRIGRETGGDPLYLDFDNVRISAANAVPEPSSLLIASVLGLGMLLLGRRRRKNV